jgi:AMP phosphorylase
MKLKAKLLGLESGGKPIIILNVEDAADLGVHSLDRVKIFYARNVLTAIVNIAEKFVEKGSIGVYNEVVSLLGIQDRDTVEVEVAKFPQSLHFIRNKLKGRKLNYDEIYQIVKDVVERNLSEVEIAAYITTLHNTGLDLEETTNLSLAMVETGRQLKLQRKVICDKHSAGGVPGDKTTLLLVPIIASLGLTIPKTSSRAITSPAGTADRAECLMPVDLTIEEMKEVVERTNGCIVWGGTLHLAPADDIFIHIEYPLGIDPMLLPSIMAKKKAVGATHLVIDIPTGRGTKVKTIGDADLLAKEFIELGQRLGINTQCAVTYGEQPIGYSIGPALEAREALEVLLRKNKVDDLEEKVITLASVLLSSVGKKNCELLAKNALNSGKAAKKLTEIIERQGGNRKIKPEDIPVGPHTIEVKADRKGTVLWIDNSRIVELARAAGAPKDKGAGILLHKKLGNRVKEGEKVMTIYAEKERKLDRAAKLLSEENPVGIREKREMLIHRVKEIPVTKKMFVLER